MICLAIGILQADEKIARKESESYMMENYLLMEPTACQRCITNCPRPGKKV